MLTRIWNYQTALENSPTFEAFEQNYGLPMVSGQPGCLGVELIRRRPEGEAATTMAVYYMISRWESYELLQAALSSQSWREEIELFLSQGFGEGNGVTFLYDPVASSL